MHHPNPSITKHSLGGKGSPSFLTVIKQTEPHHYAWNAHWWNGWSWECTSSQKLFLIH